MRSRSLLLALLVLTAGCLGAQGPEESSESQDDPPSQPSGTETVERTLVYQGNVSPGTEGGSVGVGGSTVLGTGLASLQLELTWGNSPNDFHAEAERPRGGQVTIEADQAGAVRAEGEIEDPEPGLWSFNVTASEAHLPDEVRLEVTATWKVPEDATTLEGGPVHAEQRGGSWFAWRTHQVNGTVGEDVRVGVNATNGPVNLSAGTPDVASEDPPENVDHPEDGQAHVRVRAWARANTEEQARERVEAINVSISIREDAVGVDVRAPDWEQQGTDVDVRLPADVRTSCELDTTNGPIRAQVAQTRGCRLDTTNGPIDAALAGQETFHLDTTNGPIEANLEPTGNANLTVDSTNGAIVLGLRESTEIGYLVDAETSNGRLTASMEEAQLQGSEQEAQLRTEDLDSRSIHVEGTTETTNGNVDFRGR